MRGLPSVVDHPDGHGILAVWSERSRTSFPRRVPRPRCPTTTATRARATRRRSPPAPPTRIRRATSLRATPTPPAECSARLAESPPQAERVPDREALPVVVEVGVDVDRPTPALDAPGPFVEFAIRVV